MRSVEEVVISFLLNSSKIFVVALFRQSQVSTRLRVLCRLVCTMKDCKSERSSQLSVRLAPSRRRWAPCWGLAFLATALFTLYRTRQSPTTVSASVTTAPFSWEHITPSETLQYHYCGDGFQCARLEVPMDYNRNRSRGRTFALAVVRLPAKVPVGDHRYGGPVLINPGTSAS